MNRAEMIAELTKAGITLAADATDAAVKAAFMLHIAKAAPAAASSLTEESVASIVAKAIKAHDDSRPAPVSEPRVKATDNAGSVVQPVQPDREIFTTGNVKDAAAGTGLNFARLIKAQLTAKLDGGNVVDVLKEWGYSHIAGAVERHGGLTKSAMVAMKALGQSTLTGGGALVPQEFSTEFIALLRNTACVRRSGARSIPLNGSLQMPKATGAGQAAYIGESQPITPADQTVGMITFTERKLAALTAFSNDLLKNASINAEQFVLDDLRQVMALREDLAFLFGNGGSDTPRGVESLMLAANLYAQTAASPKAPTLPEVKVELAKCVANLMAGNIPMTSLGWLFTPRTWSYLWSITDGNGNAVFQTEMAQGKLGGYPFIVTNQISNLLDGTGDASRLIFGDWAQAIIAEAQMVQAEVFPNGVYESGGQVLSGVSRDQSVVRLIAKHDFNLRYNNAFVDVKIRWGAP